MKQTVTLLAIFLLTTLFACGQNTQTSQPDHQQNLVESLKNKVDQSWVRENPSLDSTKSSFFKKDNENKYFIGLLELSGDRIPFTVDSNLSLLQFLLTLDNEINVKQGTDADEYYEGTKIVWDKKINALIWYNYQSYGAIVDNYILFDKTECPGIIFPFLKFRRVMENPNAKGNYLPGLAIFPYSDNFKIKRTETTLTTEKGLNVEGIAYDINKDGIFDIFTFTEEVEELKYYSRLYINVSGEWKCKWVSYEEVCP